MKNTSQAKATKWWKLYLSFPQSPSAPLRALRGFSRIHVAAGETQHVHFILSPRDLSEVNEAETDSCRWRLSITVGGGQPGTASTTESRVSVHGEQKLPEWNSPN